MPSMPPIRQLSLAPAADAGCWMLDAGSSHHRSPQITRMKQIDISFHRRNCRERRSAQTTHRLRVAWTARGLGAWLSFRREKVPGTAPIAPLGAQTRLSTPRGRPPARHRRGRSPLPSTLSRPRRWGDAGTPPNRRRIRRPAPRGATRRAPPPTARHAPLSRGHAKHGGTRLKLSLIHISEPTRPTT